MRFTGKLKGDLDHNVYNYNVQHYWLKFAKFVEITKISRVNKWPWFKVTAGGGFHSFPNALSHNGHTTLTLFKYTQSHPSGGTCQAKTYNGPGAGGFTSLRPSDAYMRR